MVRNAFQGIDTSYDTLLGAFDKHNDEFKKRAGKDRSQKTLYKYTNVRRHLADFIKIQYRRSDLYLKEITEEFIKGFSIYLHITLGLRSSTVHMYCIPLKMIFTKPIITVLYRSIRSPIIIFHKKSESGVIYRRTN